MKIANRYLYHLCNEGNKMERVSFEILNLSDYDPEKDIVIAYVDVGEMPPRAGRSYIESCKTALGPLIKEKGFKTLFIPCSGRNRKVDFRINTVEQETVETAESRFDDAIKVVE